MEKEWNNEHGMNRRRFLRQAVLAGSTFCVASTTGKAVGSVSIQVKSRRLP